MPENTVTVTDEELAERSSSAGGEGVEAARRIITIGEGHGDEDHVEYLDSVSVARALLTATAEVERMRETLEKALAEIESEPQCCGQGRAVERNGELEQECCGNPEYGFERAANLIRAALSSAKGKGGRPWLRAHI